MLIFFGGGPVILLQLHDRCRCLLRETQHTVAKHRPLRRLLTTLHLGSYQQKCRRPKMSHRCGCSCCTDVAALVARCRFADRTCAVFCLQPRPILTSHTLRKAAPRRSRTEPRHVITFTLAKCFSGDRVGGNPDGDGMQGIWQ